jgi:hypothetical protein
MTARRARARRALEGVMEICKGRWGVPHDEIAHNAEKCPVCSLLDGFNDKPGSCSGVKPHGRVHVSMYFDSDECPACELASELESVKDALDEGPQ